MKKFIRPVILIKGNKDEGSKLLGVARAFLDKTVLWNKNKYFKHSTLLDDGSVITVQKLLNDQYITTIIPVSPGAPLEILASFLTEIDLTNTSWDLHSGDLIDNGQGRLIFSDLTMEDTNTINQDLTGGGSIESQAGNVDWRTKDKITTWVGSYVRYRNNDSWYSDLTTTQNHNTIIRNPQGTASEEDIDITVALTFTEGGSENRTTHVRQPLRYGSKIYENGLVVANIDDIVPPTFPFGSTDRAVVGAGYNQGDLLVMVKYINWIDNFHLYRFDGGSSWTLLDTIDLGETDWAITDVFHGFFFNSDSTKCVTITKKYGLTLTMPNANSYIGTGTSGAGVDSFSLDEKDEVQELSFNVDGNNKVISFDTATILNTVNYNRVSGQERLIERTGSTDYWCVDYKTSGEPPVETVVKCSTENANTNTGTLTFDGQLYSKAGGTIGQPHFCDLRSTDLITIWQGDSVAMPSGSFETLIEHRKGNPFVVTDVLNIPSDDFKLYFNQPPVTLMAGSFTSSPTRVRSTCHANSAIDIDGNLIWVGYLRFDTGVSGIYTRELITYHSKNNVNISNLLYSENPSIDIDHRRINSLYDYSVTSWRNGSLTDKDVAICPL